METDVNTGRTRVSNSLFLFLLLLLAPHLAVSAIETDAFGRDTRITARFKDTSLVEALTVLSRQTGYAFEVPEQWLNIEVSGTFTNENLHRFFRRSMKGSSFSLIIDDRTKTVIAKDLGGTAETVQNGAAVEESRPSGFHPESGMANKDLQVLHNAQLEELREQQSDPDAIDPLSNVSNSHLKELHRRQYEEQEKRIADGSAVDPMSGLLLSELKRLHEQQLADHNK